MLIRHKDTLHELTIPDETDLGFFPDYEPVEPAAEPAAEASSPRSRKSSAALEESGVPTE